MNTEERRFVRMVRTHYRRHGRHTLPWRLTTNPYRILVSEIMLQQTQVDRVLPKYASFLQRFPTLAGLAEAPLGAVLREWQGLGYNRRAKMLHQCAQLVVKKHKGRLPRTYEELTALPGIGSYTAGAISAFAYQLPEVFVETNIRSVFIHHFFNDDTDISDADIRLMVERTLDRSDPRAWYYALMDYGVYIKKTYGNPNSKSKHYTPQTTFKGSDRQIRGALVRTVGLQSMTRKKLHQTLSFDIDRIDAQLERLIAENLITKRGQRYTLPD
jgi:A/G-specific adenine glycosylase